MKKILAIAGVTAIALSPALALADTTVPAPDFSALTSYIEAAIPIGVAALGIAIIAALAFSIVVKIGKKITSAS